MAANVGAAMTYAESFARAGEFQNAIGNSNRRHRRSGVAHQVGHKHFRNVAAAQYPQALSYARVLCQRGITVRYCRARG